MSAPTIASVDRLPAVTLDDLVEEAELLARVDRKYVVARRDLDDMLDHLPRETRVLEIDGRREFGYLSTYLDTPDLQSYLGSGRSRRGRWKVRGRRYLDTGGSWLEVKTAGARGRTLKHRVAHPDPGDAGLTVEGAALVAALVGTGVVPDLHPVLATSYQRTTLLLPGASARVTIDTELGWTSLVHGRDLDRPSLAIIETKGGSTPSVVDRSLWRRGHRPVRLSKYGAGMAALDQTLPPLKWHDALVRHLHVHPNPHQNWISRR
ncbi:polyphosphate polymerase domain-containing protein [Nocardioides sp. SYSU DS0663]|uniref:polyphosphate polymerase domain-containing protein n=1 Tax=Nocardioides sp. SYSU DS0663 TaxID=3416445 RepID=UPI003F4C245E